MELTGMVQAESPKISCPTPKRIYEKSFTIARSRRQDIGKQQKLQIYIQAFNITLNKSNLEL